MAKYDKYYEDKSYFGEPYKELMDYFLSARRGSLVDLGAGQGRDSIPLAKMGYHVTAVEESSVGAMQIKSFEPQIEIETCDLYSYDISRFDYILMDSILHFYKNDVERETRLVKTILNDMKKDSIFVNCLLKNDNAEKLLHEIIRDFEIDVELEKYIDYPKFQAVYHMIVIRKK